MANKVCQLRFLGIDSDDENISAEALCSSSGVITPDNQLITNMEQISIEARPGTKFYLNGNELIMGITGVYEIFLDEAAIEKLTFDAISINNIQEYNQRIKEYNEANPLIKRQYTPVIISMAYNE